MTAAISAKLWPWAKERGFIKRSGRVFARERGNVIQQIVVDVGGFSGRGSVYVLFSSNTPFAPNNVDNYSVGRRLGNSTSWNMRSHDSADLAMDEVLKLLECEAIPAFDRLSSLQALIEEMRTISHPRATSMFNVACTLTAMEQPSAAKETLEKAVLCDDYWARPESPARELLTAIERGEGARLVHSWAEANRAKCKVNEKDS